MLLETFLERFLTIRSKSLPRHEVREIGWYDDAEVESLPGLRIWIITAFFQSDGTKPLIKIILNRWWRWRILLSERCFIISLCMSSRPVARLDDVFFYYIFDFRKADWEIYGKLE